MTPQSVQEGAGPSVLTISALNASRRALQVPVVVPLMFTDTTTTAADYTVTGPLSVTIPAGEIEGRTTLTVTAVDDFVKEQTEIVRLEGNMNTPSNFVRGVDLRIIDAPSIVLTASPNRITENGGAQAVTVTAALGDASDSVRPRDIPVTLTWGGTAGSADYAVTAESVTIPANARSGTAAVTITPVDDLLLEMDETIELRGSTPGLTVEGTTLTLVDDEETPEVILSVDDDTVLESETGGVAVQVSARLDPSVTVSAAVVTTLDLGGSATVGASGDYTATWSSQQITIPAGSDAGSAPVTLTLTPVQDDAAEGDETIVVQGTADVQNAAMDLVVQVATITLEDDDVPGVVVAPTALEIDEGASGEYTLRLTTQPTADVRVSVNVPGGAPLQADPLSLTFTPQNWSTAQTVAVTAEADADAVMHDGVELTHSLGGGGYDAVTADSVTVTVTETTVPKLTIADASVSEDAGNLTFEVTLDVASSAEVQAAWATAAGTATAGTDYTESSGTVMFPAGTTSRTVAVPILTDDLDEVDETLTVTLTAPEHATLDDGVATGTITDDDDEPALTLAAPAAAAREGRDTSLAFTVTLSAVSGREVTVGYATADGTASAPDDFTAPAAGATLTFAAGDRSKTITIPVVDDSLAEADEETFTVRLSEPQNATLATDEATGTIEDDEETPTVSLALTPSSVAEDGGASTVTATLSGTSSEAVTVTVSATAVSPAVSGDFTQSGTTLTIAAGSTTSTGTVTLTAVNNTVDAPDKTVTVSGSVTGGNGVSAPSSQTLTIEDDEQTPTVSLVLTPSSVAEDGGSSTVTATLSGTSSETVTVTVSATAVSPAVSGDFTLSGTTLTIAAGSTTSTGSVTLTGVGNTVDAPDKTVTVSGSVTGGNGVSAPADQTLTLRDNEGTPTVSLVLTPSSVAEDGGSSTVTATLSGTSSESVTVTVSATPVSPAVFSDFTQSGATLTIAAGSTTSTGSVTLTGVGNTVDAPDKTVTVSGSVTGGNGVSAPVDQTLTLRDNEGTPTVSLVLTPSSVAEDGGSSTVTATLSGTSSESVTVTVSATPVSPAVSGDFTQSGTTLTIAAGSTTSTGSVTVTGVGNTVDAPDKTVTVSGSVTGGNGVSAPSSQTLTLRDNEGTPTVSLVLTPSSVAEDGGSSTVTATLSGTSSESVTVTVSATPVSPAVFSDFTQSGATLTIAAGSTTSTGTVTLTGVGNTVDAPDKTVTVSGSVTGGNGVSAPVDQTLTLRDNEGTPTVSLVLAPSSVAEDGGSSTVTATLSGTSSESVTVTVSATPVSPAVSGDFTQSGTTLTIAAGSTTSTGSVTVTGVGNTVDAPDKTVTVSGSVTGGNGVSAPSSQTLTLRDNEQTPTVSLVLTPSSVAEDGGSSTVTATLSGTSSESVTVTVSATPVSPAVSGDFTQNGTTLTIAAGSTTSTGTVTLTAVNNTVDAPDKTVTVSGTVTGGNGVSAPSSQTLTIEDDEGTPTVSLVLAPSSVAENGGASAVTATLSGTSSELVTVTVSATAVSPAVSGDFTQSGTTLTIAAGSTTSTGTVTLTAVNNTVDAPDKTVTVSGTVTGGNGVSAPSSRTLTIEDDEGTPTVSLVLAPELGG